MPCNLTSNWLETARNKLPCGYASLTVEHLRSLQIAFQIEWLLCECPTILDSDEDPTCNIAGSETLTRLYNKVSCGEVLSTIEIEWAQAMIYLKQKECCEQNNYGYGEPV